MIILFQSADSAFELKTEMGLFHFHVFKNSDLSVKF